MEEGIFMNRLTVIIELVVSISKFHYEQFVDILLSGRIDSCLRKLTTLKQSCLIKL
jgi:hypothetical protein